MTSFYKKSNKKNVIKLRHLYNISQKITLYKYYLTKKKETLFGKKKEAIVKFLLKVFKYIFLKILILTSFN